jgi:hypothetical protein
MEAAFAPGLVIDLVPTCLEIAGKTWADIFDACRANIEGMILYRILK